MRAPAHAEPAAHAERAVSHPTPPAPILRFPRIILRLEVGFFPRLSSLLNSSTRAHCRRKHAPSRSKMTQGREERGNTEGRKRAAGVVRV